MIDSYVLHRAAPVLWTRNIHLMLDYYTRQLGFGDVWKQGNPESPDYAIATLSGVQIHFSPSKPEYAGHSYFHILVTRVDAYWAFVSNKQVSVINPLGTREYGMRDFIIRDIEGNLIEFGEELEH